MKGSPVQITYAVCDEAVTLASDTDDIRGPDDRPISGRASLRIRNFGQSATRRLLAIVIDDQHISYRRMSVIPRSFRLYGDRRNKWLHTGRAPSAPRNSRWPVSG